MAKELFHDMQFNSINEPGRLFVEKIEDLVGVDIYQQISTLNIDYDRVMRLKEAYDKATASEEDMKNLELSYRKQVQALEDQISSVESKIDYYQKKIDSLDEKQLDAYDNLLDEYRFAKKQLAEVKQERNEKVNLQKTHETTETSRKTLEEALEKFNTNFEKTFAGNDILIRQLSQAIDPANREKLISECIAELSPNMDKKARKFMPEGLNTMSTLVRNEASFLRKSLYASYRLNKHFKENGINAELPDKIKVEYKDWNLLKDNSTQEFQNSTMIDIFIDEGSAKYLNAIWEYMENGNGGSIDFGALYKQCKVKINSDPASYYGTQWDRALAYNQSIYDQTHQQEDGEENEI